MSGTRTTTSAAALLPLVLVLVVSFPSATAFVGNRPFVSTTARSNQSIIPLFMAQRRGRPRGPLRVIEQKPTMNQEITQSEVRVVIPNPKGTGKDEPLGIMSKEEALQKAQDMGGLDLILINENSDPPVCKIVDYSKWRYMKEKKAKELKKNAKATEVKEVKMSYKIDVHDYDVRKRNAQKFLLQGNRVKCTVMFRGREMQHDALGFDLLAKLAEELEKVASPEGKPKREGRQIGMMLSPKPEVLKKINDDKRALEKKKKKQKDQSLVARQEAEAVAAAAASEAAAEAQKKEETMDALANSLKEEDDDALSASLDDLLGSDDLTDELFG